MIEKNQTTKRFHRIIASLDYGDPASSVTTANCSSCPLRNRLRSAFGHKDMENPRPASWEKVFNRSDFILPLFLLASQ